MSRDVRKYRDSLDELYEKLNRREYVSPDPLEVLYDYEDLRDREIVGAVAASLASGRVKAIVAGVRDVLARIGRPYEFITNSTADEVGRALHGFYFRWVSVDDMATLLVGIGAVVRKHGSLETCFVSNFDASDETVFEALKPFVCKIAVCCGLKVGRRGLAPECPHGSKWLFSINSAYGAVKKWNLYLRWMVRSDAVDPGGWMGVPPSKLIVPLDTHMLNIATALGMTGRGVANRACALEVTEAFRMIAPDDPVRYDFALTRLGIRDDCDMDAFIRKCGLSR